MSAGMAADAVEAAFRDLRGAIHRADGPAALAAVRRLPLDEAPQHAGDGLLLAIAQGVPGAAELAGACLVVLRERDLAGDAELADELEAALGAGPVPLLRGLPVDLDELSDALEGDPLLSGGRIDLRSGEIDRISPLFGSDDLELLGLDDDGEADGAETDDGEADGAEDAGRWLWLDPLGSRPGYRDMEDYLATVDDERLAGRLERALGGRGVFRRFKDVLADVPGELARFYRFTDDRRRGRARRWLAAEGWRPAVSRAPTHP